MLSRAFLNVVAVSMPRTCRGKSMPILPMEPFLYPDDLISTLSGSEGEGAWWVLHTHPRAEKALARKLLKKELPFFLPMYHKTWRSRGRTLSSHLPLFPGYLFVRGADIRYEVLATNQVARVLPVPDQERFHDDLQRVYRLMQGEVPLTPEQRLEPGTSVEIVAGPLAGLQGTVVRRGKQMRFFVEVTFLCQGVSIELEPWMLRAADPVRS
jgi:transcriptional antiterminator RfaH